MSRLTSLRCGQDDDRGGGSDAAGQQQRGCGYVIARAVFARACGYVGVRVRV